ncbi:hypothetical protein LT493_35510 [Streptomyces tricolor]|nr:hypothetical protein [Streptomyces tricolor]
MRLRLREFRPPHRAVHHRIVQPRQPPAPPRCGPRTPIGLLLGDHDGLEQARRTLLPRRLLPAHDRPHAAAPQRPADGGVGGWSTSSSPTTAWACAPSQWPELRHRLRQGTPLTVRTDEARTARDAAAWRDTLRAGRLPGRTAARHARAYVLPLRQPVRVRRDGDLARPCRGPRAVPEGRRPGARAR